MPTLEEILQAQIASQAPTTSPIPTEGDADIPQPQTEFYQEQQQLAETNPFRQMGESAAEDDVLGVSTAGLTTFNDAGQDELRGQFFQGLTFGLSDEIEAAKNSVFSGNSYDSELNSIRASAESFKKNEPISATVAELTGAISNPAYMAKVPQALSKLSPVSQAMIKGGTGGFLYGAGTSEGNVVERLQDGAVMAIPSALFAGGVTKIVNKLGNKTVDNALQATDSATTVQTLKTAQDKAYKVLDESTTLFTPKDMNRVRQMANAQAQEIGYVGTVDNPLKAMTHPILAKSFSYLNTLKKQTLSLKQTENIRRVLKDNASQAYRSGAKDEYRAIKGMIDDLDDMVNTKLAQEGSDSIAAARLAHQRYAKVRDLDEALQQAKTRATTTGTGGNVENQMRQAVARILRKKNINQLYSPKEQEMMRKFAEGGLKRDAYRLIGKLSPTDNGLMTALQIGAAAYDPTFMLTAGMGWAAKYFGKKVTAKDADKLLMNIGGINQPVRQAVQTTNRTATVTPSGIEGLLNFVGQ